MAGECLAYRLGGNRVLVAYPLAGLDFWDTPIDTIAFQGVADTALGAVLDDMAADDVTVLAPLSPQAIPAGVDGETDEYWFLPLPLPEAPQKVRNMLARAGRECRVTQETWGAEHAALVAEHDRRHGSGEAERYIHARLSDYLTSSPDVALFAARTMDGKLAGFCIGDFSSLGTAFYMFAFRSLTAPPGTADLLLAALAAEGEIRGHGLLNLGLGITEGVRFFKKKWGAQALLPYREFAWKRADSGRRGAVVKGDAVPPALERRTVPVNGDPLLSVKGPGFGARFRDFMRGGKREFESIQVEVSSRCPARCTYCPHTTKKAVWKSRDLDPAAFAALTPLLPKLERVHLQGWGEPLLHPRFFDMAALARRYGCAVSTTTCGLGMTAEKAAGLVAAGLDIVAFSVAGCTEEGNAPRSGATLATVRSAIALLRAARDAAQSAGPSIHLAYIMLASTMDEVRLLPDFMAEVGADAAVVSTLDYIAAPGMENEAFSPHDADMIARARPLLEEARADAASRGLFLHYALPTSRSAAECREHISRSLYMDAEGTISPCIYVNLPTEEDDADRRTFGNVLREDPVRIWHSAPFRAFRDRLASGNPDGACLHCPKRFEEE